MLRYDKDTLVQQTAADYLRDALGWRNVRLSAMRRDRGA